MTKKRQIVQGNAQLNRAQADPNDEFYTREDDIEMEIGHYESHFRNKVVYCNCDDPTVSGFYRYFTRNFAFLELNKLITTCYEAKDPFGWTKYKDGNGFRIDFDGKQWTKKMKGDGDFRNKESIRILREADIVVTNPPFSLFREYVAQLIDENKKFLILGSMNAVSYKDIFRMIMAEKIWLGVVARPMKFDKPDGSVSKMGNVRWFTNLSHENRNMKLDTRRKYKGNEIKYPKYDNYNAINVNQIAEIPLDYSGIMGVPLSFLENWNPDQFELIGADYDVHLGLISYLANPKWNGKIDRGYIDGKRKFSRIFIRNKEPKK